MSSNPVEFFFDLIDELKDSMITLNEKKDASQSHPNSTNSRANDNQWSRISFATPSHARGSQMWPNFGAHSAMTRIDNAPNDLRYITLVKGEFLNAIDKINTLRSAMYDFAP